jgi:hypothetical protein
MVVAPWQEAAEPCRACLVPDWLLDTILSCIQKTLVIYNNNNDLVKTSVEQHYYFCAISSRLILNLKLLTSSNTDADPVIKEIYQSSK